jgi:hypothetical protein
MLPAFWPFVGDPSVTWGFALKGMTMLYIPSELLTPELISYIPLIARINCNFRGNLYRIPSS